MPRRGKARHVGADLGEDRLRAAALDADHRAQQLNRRRERAQLFLDRVGELYAAERARYEAAVETLEVRNGQAQELKKAVAQVRSAR